MKKIVFIIMFLMIFKTNYLFAGLSYDDQQFIDSLPSTYDILKG